MSVAKKLASQTAVYGLSSIWGGCLRSLWCRCTPLGLSAGEYGIVTDLYAYVAFLNIVFTYGMETAYFRFANRPGTDRRHLYSQVMSLLLVSSVVLSGFLVLLSGPVADVLPLPRPATLYRVACPDSGPRCLVAVPFARLRLENKAKKFAAIRFTNTLGECGLEPVFHRVLPRCVRRAHAS